MSGDATTVLQSEWEAPRLTPAQGATGSTEPHVSGSTAFVPRRMSVAERGAILEALYVERRPLTRAVRSGQLSPLDQQHLEDIERYIDFLESEDSRENSGEIDEKLAEFSRLMLALRTDLERSGK